MIKLSEKQKENIYSSIHGVDFELNEGTIRSGKTFSDIQKMAILIAGSKDQNHLVTAYNQEQAFRMFMDGEGFGLAHIFEGHGVLRSDRHGDHLLLKLPNGEKKVYYKGGGKANSVGAITGMSFGTITFLEFNLLNKEFIEECFRRTLAAKNRFHLAEQNPPAPNHPNLETIEPFIKTGRYRFRHWRPHDNPILTGKRLKDWEEQCKVSDYLYKRDWLGQRVMPEGIIYSMFDQDAHFTKDIQGKVIETFFTCDAGQGDATTCAFWCVTFKEGQFYLYRLANYYHSGTESGQVKAMSVYAKEIKTFVEYCYREFQGYPHHNYFFVDPASKALREELHLVGIETDKADNNSRDKVTSNGMKIEVGIERAQNLLDKRQVLFYDIESQHDHSNIMREMGMYVRLDNGRPIDNFNHALDEFRYGCNYFYKTYVK